MFQNLIIKYAKSWIVGKINDLLEKNKDNVSEICSTINVWLNRLEIITNQLKTISDRASDGNIDDDEVEKSISEIETIIREWK